MRRVAGVYVYRARLSPYRGRLVRVLKRWKGKVLCEVVDTGERFVGLARCLRRCKA